MSCERKSDRCLEPYRRALASRGAGFGATLWTSREAQVLRFDIMAEMADFADSVILDAGCGHGDFAARLIERGMPFRRLIGIDALPAQIEEAMRRGVDRCEFHVADFMHHPTELSRYGADWIVFSGSLNTMEQSEAIEILQVALASAGRGVVFNFLSDRTGPRRCSETPRPVKRFNTMKMLDWSLAHSARVQFRQDYLDGHDATVCIERCGDEENRG